MSDRAFGTEGRNQDSIGWTASAGNPSPKLGSGNVKVACDLLLKAHADLASSRCPTDTDYASSPTPTLLTRALDALNRVFNEAHSSITYETATDSAPTPAKEAIPSFSTTNTRHASRASESTHELGSKYRAVEIVRCVLLGASQNRREAV